jgi:hypothetical protein
MLISDLERKHPWASHSLVRLCATWFSEDEWNAIHKAGLEELIRTNVIFDEQIIELLLSIYREYKDRKEEFAAIEEKLNAALESPDDSSSAELIAEMAWKSGDTMFAHFVTASIKKFTLDHVAETEKPKIDTLLATGFSKEILDNFLSVSIGPEIKPEKKGSLAIMLPYHIDVAIHLLTTPEEEMPYLDKKTVLKDSFQQESCVRMMKAAYPDLDLTPGTLCEFTEKTITPVFVSKFLKSDTSVDTSVMFKPYPSEERCGKFKNLLMSLSKFYDCLHGQLEATHSTTNAASALHA